MIISRLLVATAIAIASSISVAGGSHCHRADQLLDVRAV